MRIKRVTTSLALIVLMCFFLPWVQLSCGASESTLSGIDLARDGQSGLWLIPVLLLAVLLLGITQVWKDRRELSAIVGLVSGLVSAYLMNRERMRAQHTWGFLTVGLTFWFWLGVCSSVGLAVLSALRFLKRRPAS